ncbi:MAG: hypothetical protein IT376_02980 [Polyangiaceae bacterium]|nr:hypothetical protein [Polyangiaceae bacterium]
MKTLVDQPTPGGALPNPTTGDYFRWLVALRWVAIGGVAAALVGTERLLGLRPASGEALPWWVLGALALYNLALSVLGGRREVAWLTHFAAQILVDCLALALLVHEAGGVENPFLPLLVLHVVNANIVLEPRAALALLGFALTAATIVVVGEGMSWLPHHCLRGGGDACWARPLGPWSLGTLAALGLTLGSSSYFARYLTRRLHDSEGRLAASVSALSTEKERLAEIRSAVETERTRLQAIIDCMGDAVTFSDPAGEVLLSNRRARELRGHAGAEGAEPGPRATGDLPAREGRVVFERGGKSLETTRSEVRGPGGKSLGLVAVTRDISERVALERHLMDDERMVVVGKMAAAVAHEINNPIGVVSLYAQHALAKLPQDSPLAKHLETIQRNAESCRKITRELLELARPRTPERRPFDLRALCRDIAQSVEPLATRQGVRLSDQSRSGTAPLWVEGDPDQLRQALLNLTLNAIEACEAGDRVFVRAYETQDGDATARVVEVADTGAGISQETLAQIFQPFFTTKPAGTGLGLAVADHIVKAHGGRVAVESTPGRGTAFRLLLPAGRAAGAA